MNTHMPAGFRYTGVNAGIKNRKKDVALIVSDCVAAVAGVFTTNRVQAAPVRLCRERVASGTAQAVVVNSGNANACTGQAGFNDALETARTASSLLNIPEDNILVCSTGTIGVRLPMDRIKKGVHAAVAALSPDGFDDVALAIMTTDTRPKQVSASLAVDGCEISICGMAKGSGMIDPAMATMLAFITTDASVEREALQRCLSGATEMSFNRITVDGDQSTNDTVLMLANGMAGNRPLNMEHPAWPAFYEAVSGVAKELAVMIVKDGEGATKFVTVRVQGAANSDDARLAAKAVAGSLLVKTAWYGADPNWGRIIAALGYSGAEIDEKKVAISFDDLVVVEHGVAARDHGEALVGIISKDEFTVGISLGIGDGTHEIYSCDISHGYVDINASYMT